MKMQQALTTLITNQMTRMHRDRTRANAVRNAHTFIAKRHRIWVESGFDMHFLHNRAALLLEPFYQHGAVPDPQALALAWREQFFFSEERQQKAFDNILPIMKDFVHVLKGELVYLETKALAPQPNAQSNFARSS